MNSFFWIGSNSYWLECDINQLIEQKRVCKKCKMPLDGNSIDIHLIKNPCGEAFAWTTNINILILNINFAKKLGYPFDTDTFTHGLVFDKDNKIINDYITVNSNQRYFIRGSKEPRLGKKCDLCNRFNAYTPQGGPLYIIDTENINSTILMTQCTTFLVNKNIITKKELKCFKDIVIEDSNILVFKHAHDGFSDEEYTLLKF